MQARLRIGESGTHFGTRLRLASRPRATLTAASRPPQRPGATSQPRQQRHLGRAACMQKLLRAGMRVRLGTTRMFAALRGKLRLVPAIGSRPAPAKPVVVAAFALALAVPAVSSTSRTRAVGGRRERPGHRASRRRPPRARRDNPLSRRASRAIEAASSKRSRGIRFGPRPSPRARSAAEALADGDLSHPV